MGLVTIGSDMMLAGTSRTHIYLRGNCMGQVTIHLEDEIEKK